MISHKRIIISLLVICFVGASLASSIWAMSNPRILLTPTPIPSIEATSTPTPAPPAGTIAEDWKGTEMIYVPAGTFEMGVSVEVASNLGIENFSLSEENSLEYLDPPDDSSLAPYRVTLRGFWIDRYEVSNEQYQQCVESGRCESVPEWSLEVNNHPQKPIVAVSWYDALKYCSSRYARLPTEEEWEYAASGPDNNALPWGNTGILDHISPNLDTHPVGSFLSDVSWVGAYDMAHNVSEWTEDRFAPYPSFEGIWRFQIESDITRVVRGGSIENADEKTFTFVRQHASLGTLSPIIGFRCARSSDPRE